jgi:hypothetical protein
MVFSEYSGPSTNKTDRHDMTEILLKVAFNTITLFGVCYYVELAHQTGKKILVNIPYPQHTNCIHLKYN